MERLSNCPLAWRRLLERIESRNGVLTIEAAAGQGYGSREYELVEV